MNRPSVFARRRSRFFDAMKEGVAVLFAAPEAAFSHDVHYRYRPDPDLFYLTGFGEPEAVAVLDADLRTFTLFVRPKDRAKETWEGRRSGTEGAARDFGADAAHPIAELPRRLPDLLRRARALHYAFGSHSEGDRIVAGLLARFRREARHARRGPVSVADPTDLLHTMRLVKTPDEIALMQRAATIAAAAHRDARRLAKPGLFEYQIEAAIDR
ncbi:MAG TPA: aminopeptidase P N-terminal domain-containing protein, partial [Thermoanaerobaculia bacterium]